MSQIFKLVNGRLKTIFFATLKGHAAIMELINYELRERPRFIRSSTHGPPRIILDIDFWIKLLNDDRRVPVDQANYCRFKAKARAVFAWNSKQQSFQPIEDTRGRLIDFNAPSDNYAEIWQMNIRYSIGERWDASPRKRILHGSQGSLKR